MGSDRAFGRTSCFMRFHLKNLPDLYGSRRGPAVRAALVALLAIQIAAPPQLSSFNAAAHWQELDEQQDGESNESDSEQSLPELIGPASNRPPRAEARIVSRPIASPRPRARNAFDRISAPAELVHRNGAGGPLRC